MITDLETNNETETTDETNNTNNIDKYTIGYDEFCNWFNEQPI